MSNTVINCTEKFMNPFNDHSFKVIFGREENKSLLIDFLNSLLVGERHIKDVFYRDKEQIQNEGSRRSAIYDIYCTDDNGDYFIVEMQNQYQPNFVNRMVYYSSHSIVRQGRVGSNWTFEIKAVYCIAFMRFKDDCLGNKLIKKASICDSETGEQLTDLLRFVFIQLPLFNKPLEQCDTQLDKWIYVLKNMNVLTELPKSLMCPAFEKLKEISDVSKMTLEEYDRYLDAQMAYNDLCGVIQGGWLKGEEQGRAEGEAKGRAEGEAKGRAEGEAKGRAEGRAEGATEQNIKNAKSMKSEGLSADMISRITGLSIDEINKL